MATASVRIMKVLATGMISRMSNQPAMRTAEAPGYLMCKSLLKAPVVGLTLHLGAE
jgi:hypothetical protein